jgi:hypothetical protein
MLHRLAVVAAFAVLPALAFAGGKAAKKPSGSYSRAAGDRKVTWTFKDDTLAIAIKIGEGSIHYDASYGVTKDGVLFGVMTKAEKKGPTGGPDKGDLFSFQFTLGMGELKISDLKGTAVDDEAKRLVEGTYKQEK